MAPEQFLEGGRYLDRRADIYAAGVMLWQALTGQILWPRGTDEMEVIRRVTGGDVPRPSSRKEGVPPDLEAVCMKALSVRRADRFATALEMQTEIEGHLE
jgi:serine/threonine-protein kinase